MKKLLYVVLCAFIAVAVKAEPPAEVVDLTSEETADYAFFSKTDKTKKSKYDETSDNDASPRTISGAPHIALLLPLTGEYATGATAIRDGFISAYYLKKNDPNIDIRVYDTKNDNNIVTTYENALNQGANIVVGPLTKPGIERLIDSKKIDNDIPLITLNTVESRNRLPRYLYPFALNPEDEAYRLAEQAKHDGHTSAVILAQDDSYGGRAARAFKNRFEQLNGRVVDILYFEPQRALEDPVRYILDIDDSGHPRRVIDFIFLAAKPQQARQIPPLLKFYYSAGVPIYAMSSVYEGAPNAALDNDLNGIVFCDSPWVTNPANRDVNLNNAASQTLRNPAAQDRLFAFGVDAFLVAEQVGRLSNVSQLNINGTTGQLFMDNSGFVVRNPPCARFSLGVPRAL